MGNLIDEAIAKWKTSDEHLVVWGGGLLGGKVVRILEANNIKYDAIAVNRIYLKDSESNEVCLEDYLESHKCSLIVAFSGYNESLLDGLEKSNIENVYALDWQGRYAALWDTKISEELLKTRKQDYERLVEHLGDESSKVALEEYLAQKMNSNYYKEYSSDRQYFEKGIVALDDGEVFVDCGGFDGADTDYYFSMKPSKKNKVIIFEPDVANYTVIAAKFTDNRLVKVYNAGVGEKDCVLKFESDKGTSSSFSENGNVEVRVMSLDNCLRSEEVSFIKKDIEGFEIDALRGARDIISIRKPKLAICVYHKAEDIFDISNFILDTHDDYKLYFRSYHAASTEAVLYAI